MSIESPKHARHTLGPGVTFAIIVSNMVGTGVFSSLGFQAQDLKTGFALLALWAIGGVTAFCGALSYAELGASLPRSGGEFVYLARAFRPWLGFVGGFVSMTAGFAAPIALAGIAFGRYVSQVLPLTPDQSTWLVLALIGAVHFSHVRLAQRFQVAITALTLLLILLFVGAGLWVGARTEISLAPTPAALAELMTPGFAVSLIYVSYAYTGWNAAGYVAGEVRSPERVIPRSVSWAVGVVTVLYVLLNWTFLRTIPMDELVGKVEIGTLSASALFGPSGARWMSAGISALLVATISALVLAGSRVTEAWCAALPRLARLTRQAPEAPPRAALALQFGLIAVLIATHSFESVLAYAGLTLSLMSLLTIVGLFALRRREPALVRPYRVWGYPFTPIVFALLTVWMIAFTLRERPAEALASVLTLAIGSLAYWRFGDQSRDSV